MKTGLQAAIKKWSTLADSKARFALALSHIGADESLIRETIMESRQAQSVVEALRMEEKTGVVHCGCTDPPHPRK